MPQELFTPGTNVKLTNAGALCNGVVLEAIGDRRVHQKVRVEFFDPHCGYITDWFSDTELTVPVLNGRAA